MRILMLTTASLVAAMAMSAPAGAQYRYDNYSGSYDYRGGGKVEREYHKKFAEERRECSKKQREADSRGEWREARHECRKKLAEVEREYQKKLREASRERYEDRRERDYDDDYDD